MVKMALYELSVVESSSKEYYYLRWPKLIHACVQLFSEGTTVLFNTLNL